MTRYYSPRDLAQLLQCNEEVVRRWLRDGKLSGIQLGGRHWRVSDQDLKAFLKSLRPHKLRKWQKSND